MTNPLLGWLLVSTGVANTLVTGTARAPHRGVYEIEMPQRTAGGNPFLDVDLRFVFTLPDGKDVRAEGFYKGDGRWAGRAYVAQVGVWNWRTESNQTVLDGARGSFEVAASGLPGKLRRHVEDSRQFVYDDGRWFLHLGDTGYRYVTDTEPLWRQYIDEAAQVGFTKIRTWLCRGRSDIAAVFAEDRAGLDLAYWNEIERRLVYALETHPLVQFQVILFGEDAPELARYGAGEPASRLIARYAQARFSAFPNVHWCLSNDLVMSPGPGKRHIDPAILDRLGQEMRAREPWGTLLTNHQARFQGYTFADATWSDIITLEDRDQVAGALIGKYRALGDDPVVLDEDRYGLYLSPRHDRYFFRRLMWASLLSGGHATYGGLNTHEPFAGSDRASGIQGYLTAVRDGRLDDGAADFPHIRSFFADAGLSLVGLLPNDAMAGDDGERVKVIAGSRTIIAYLQNPEALPPETANVAETRAACRLQLPAGDWQVRWFDVRTGRWPAHHEPSPTKGGAAREFQSPFPGDAVLLLTQS